MDKKFYKLLPPEIWLIISENIKNNGELRSLFYLYKLLGWGRPDTKYFYEELKKERDKDDRDPCYNKRKIDLWERTGIDDELPNNYIYSQCNNKFETIYKTMWASIICEGKIFNMMKLNLDKYYIYNKYSNILMIDNRDLTMTDKESCQKFPCSKCINSYYSIFNESTSNHSLLLV
jgi:hypothetical protein